MNILKVGFRCRILCVFTFFLFSHCIGGIVVRMINLRLVLKVLNYDLN